MSSVATKVTPEEYLERERAAEYKSEYRDGEIVAMSGARYRHALVVSNLSVALALRVRSKGCSVLTTDLRLAIRAANLITYPDVLVICGKPEFAYDRDDVVVNPVILIEVLSKSTRKYDRGEKFAAYRTIPSLREYLAVEQIKIHIEQHVRQSSEQWILTEFSDPQTVIPLASLAIEIRVADIYENIQLGEERD
jgi:Uma2 family endonuclease